MAISTKKKTFNAKKTDEVKVDRTKEAMELLEAGVKRLTESGEWTKWLQAQAAFHRYSFANTMLILSQCPEATRVAGFKTWIKLGRCVMKGSKAIWILAPRFFKAKEEEFRQADAEKPSKSGEDEEEKVRIYFRPVPVFDFSQTEGEDLPSPVKKLTGDDDGGLFDRLKGFSEERGCPVTVEVIKRSANGFYSPLENRIVIAEGLSPVQMVKTLAHEICHAQNDRDPEVYAAHRADCELVAESVAFVVLNHFGIDSGDYSFGYLASWQDGSEQAVKALKACATRIAQTAKAIIDGISGEDQAEEEEVAAA